MSAKKGRGGLLWTVGMRPKMRDQFSFPAITLKDLSPFVNTLLLKLLHS